MRLVFTMSFYAAAAAVTIFVVEALGLQQRRDERDVIPKGGSGSFSPVTPAGRIYRRILYRPKS